MYQVCTVSIPDPSVQMRMELMAYLGSTESLALRNNAASHVNTMVQFRNLRGEAEWPLLAPQSVHVNWNQRGQKPSAQCASLAFFSTGIISSRAVSTNIGAYYLTDELSQQTLEWPNQSYEGNQNNILVSIFLAILKKCDVLHSKH